MISYPFRHRSLLLLPVVLATTLFACSREEGDPEREKMERTTVDSLNSTMGDTPERDMPTVEVALGDAALKTPTSHKAGPIALSIRNDGTGPHSLQVLGEGVSQKMETSLQPGETRIMTLALKPGVYSLTCPLVGHDTLHGAPAQLAIGQ